MAQKISNKILEKLRRGAVAVAVAVGLLGEIVAFGLSCWLLRHTPNDSLFIVGFILTIVLLGYDLSCLSLAWRSGRES
jgi:hypothetical protein